LLVAELAGDYVRNIDRRLQRWISLARDHGVGSVGFYGGTLAFEGDPHQSLDEHQPAEYRR
jgi:hypothetical protein